MTALDRIQTDFFPQEPHVVTNFHRTVIAEADFLESLVHLCLQLRIRIERVGCFCQRTYAGVAERADLDPLFFGQRAKFRAAMSVVWRTSSDLTGNPQHPKASRSLKCIPNSWAVSPRTTHS